MSLQRRARSLAYLTCSLRLLLSAALREVAAPRSAKSTHTRQNFHFPQHTIYCFVELSSTLTKAIHFKQERNWFAPPIIKKTNHYHNCSSNSHCSNPFCVCVCVYNHVLIIKRFLQSYVIVCSKINTYIISEVYIGNRTA